MAQHASRRDASGVRRQGSTLIELVTAVLLLGLLTTPILSAFADYREGIAIANKKAVAVEVADRFLAEWAAAGWRPPKQTAGRIDDRWQYRLVEGQELALFGERCRTRTLQVFEAPARIDSQPLVQVEVVVP
jgi:Tfp pilus assembly protein PilE